MNIHTIFNIINKMKNLLLIGFLISSWTWALFGQEPDEPAIEPEESGDIPIETVPPPEPEETVEPVEGSEVDPGVEESTEPVEPAVEEPVEPETVEPVEPETVEPVVEEPAVETTETETTETETTAAEGYTVLKNKSDSTKDYMTWDIPPANKIKTIHYNFNQRGYSIKHKPVMHAVMQELVKKPDHGVLIVGHTCHIGSYKSNLKLSWGRAASVRKGLVMHGLDKSRTKISGKSYSQQINKNGKNEKKRRKNRRVEFFIKPLSELFGGTPADYTVTE
jgi:outer membrane protein OmpA-like peptidoglycan-associated protein